MPVPNRHRHRTVDSDRHRHLRVHPDRHGHLKCRLTLAGTRTGTGTFGADLALAPEAPVEVNRQRKLGHRYLKGFHRFIQCQFCLLWIIEIRFLAQYLIALRVRAKPYMARGHLILLHLKRTPFSTSSPMRNLL